MKFSKSGKAIRDKIPQIIKNSGTSCTIKTLSDAQFLKALEVKLGEELQEYLASKSSEELADLIEVIHRIAQLNGTSIAKLEKIRKDKARKRGAFKKNLFLIDFKK